MTRDHTCFNCGAPACRGYRKRGLLSAQKHKGYLWSCTSPECLEIAEQRKGNE